MEQLSDNKELSLALQVIINKIINFLKNNDYNFPEPYLTSNNPIAFKTTPVGFNEEITITFNLKTKNFQVQRSMYRTKVISNLLNDNLKKIFTKDCYWCYSKALEYENIIKKEEVQKPKTVKKTKTPKKKPIFNKSLFK